MTPPLSPLDKHLKILVTKYQVPEQVGNLFTPAGHRFTAGWAWDTTHTIWEVYRSTPASDEHVGMALAEGDIIQVSRRHAGNFVARVDGQDVFALPAQIVSNVWPKSTWLDPEEESD